jgi:hypothetical protein
MQRQLPSPRLLASPLWDARIDFSPIALLDQWTTSAVSVQLARLQGAQLPSSLPELIDLKVCADTPAPLVVLTSAAQAIYSFPRSGLRRLQPLLFAGESAIVHPPFASDWAGLLSPLPRSLSPR